MKNKDKYVDDGHTIYSMDALNEKKKGTDLGLTPKERFALIRAALSAYFPKLLLVIICFILAAILVWLWLKF